VVQCVLCIILMSFSPLMHYVYSTVEFSNWPFRNTFHHQLFPQSSFDVRRCLTEIHIAILRGASLLISNRSPSRHSSSKPFSFFFSTHTRTLSTPHRQQNRFQCIDTRPRPSVHPFVRAMQLTLPASTPPVPSMRHLHAVNAPPIPPCNVQPRGSLTVTFQRSTRQLHAG